MMILFYLGILLCLFSVQIGHANKLTLYRVFGIPEHQHKRKRDDSKIINGEEADPHEFPFMAMITGPDGLYMCGASLIDRSWVLTAGHCGENAEAQDENVHVRLGSHSKLHPTDTEQILEVDRIILHENLDSKNATNDIALLHLTTPAQINKQVQQICMYLGDHSFQNQSLMAMGWGTENVTTTETSDVLKKLKVTGISNDDCDKAMDLMDRHPPIYEGTLCVYGGGDGKEVCTGDSGSPLVWKDRYGQWRQVGVTSWGVCTSPTQDLPTVYARISYFFDWIQTNAAGAKIC